MHEEEEQYDSQEELVLVRTVEGFRFVFVKVEYSVFMMS